MDVGTQSLYPINNIGGVPNTCNVTELQLPDGQARPAPSAFGLQAILAPSNTHVSSMYPFGYFAVINHFLLGRGTE